MASVDKFTNDEIAIMLRHNERKIIEPHNVDIDFTKSDKNYSFNMNHDPLSDYEYYKQLIDTKYIYGRGSQREKEAITGCGWVITAPKEICGDFNKEYAFFQGVFDFVSHRYGAENIINNACHYDEAGAPHIHIIFCPVTEINHDKIHYKTAKTKEAIKLDTGRYEFNSKYHLNQNGQRIPVKNYARISDYYDEKISANDVLNKIELKYFHSDLQHYLDSKGIEGKVLTGKTSGINYSVKELKEFTQKTGFRLEEVKEMLGNHSILQSYIEQHKEIDVLTSLLSQEKEIIQSLRNELVLNNKTAEISTLKDLLMQKDEQLNTLAKELSDSKEELTRLTNKNLELEQQLKEKTAAYEKLNEFIHNNTITTNKQINIEESHINKPIERSKEWDIDIEY